MEQIATPVSPQKHWLRILFMVNTTSSATVAMLHLQLILPHKIIPLLVWIILASESKDPNVFSH